MRTYTIEDYHLFHKLKRKLRTKTFLTKAEKNLLYCHSRTKSNTGVTVVKRDKKVGFKGLFPCNNSWCCPCCAPYRLARTQYYLEAGFEMLKERGYKCLMITFTVPHSSYFKGYSDLEWRPHLHTLGDTLYLLNRTFSKFTRKARFTRLARRIHTITKEEARYTDETSKKKRQEQKYAAENTEYYSFYIHETTWGSKNGWHPHIHMLLWLTPQSFDYFKNLEEKLAKIWRESELEVINEMTWLQNNVKNNWKDLINNPDSSNTKGIYFSKDKNGNVREMTTRNYFWSGATEVTSLPNKTGRGMNLTSWEILKKALDETNEKHEFYFNLYLELVNTIPGVNLWTFKRGFLPQIRQYIKSNPRALIQKKKSWQEKNPRGKIQIICWLSQEQWKLLNQQTQYLQIVLASLAIQDDAFELIKELCEVFKVGPPLKKPPFSIKIFENENAA